MINNILIYLGIAFISWLMFMFAIYIALEVIEFVIDTWSNYGK